MSAKEEVKETGDLKFTFRGISYDKNGKVMIKDDRVEIVRKETKVRYTQLLEEHLISVEILKEEVCRLSGIMKEIANNEIIEVENIIDREIKRLAEMVVVDKEGEVFARQ